MANTDGTPLTIAYLLNAITHGRSRVFGRHLLLQLTLSDVGIFDDRVIAFLVMEDVESIERDCMELKAIPQFQDFMDFVERDFSAEQGELSFTLDRSHWTDPGEHYERWRIRTKRVSVVRPDIVELARADGAFTLGACDRKPLSRADVSRLKNAQLLNIDYSEGNLVVEFEQIECEHGYSGGALVFTNASAVAVNDQAYEKLSTDIFSYPAMALESALWTGVNHESSLAFRRDLTGPDHEATHTHTLTFMANSAHLLRLHTMSDVAIRKIIEEAECTCD